MNPADMQKYARMKLLPKMMMAAVSGVFTGASLVFLVIVGALSFTYPTTKAVHLPGLIQAWFTTENAMPAVNFQPNFAGMLVLVGVVAAMFCFSTWRQARGGSSDELPECG